jgi:tetratricopeptide (TPR) repeat protein
MAAMDQEKWSEAIPALASAEEYANSKEKNVVKPRPWFGAYLLFYRGYCQMQVGKTGDAVKQFDKLVNDPAFKDSRFLPQAYENLLECHRELGDVAKMEEVEKKIEQAPAELRTDLTTRARRQRAELLSFNNKFEEAKKLFEQISTASDPEIAAAGTSGVIRCLTGLKDAPGVESYCNKVLTTASAPSLLLIASNALGDSAFEKKQYAQARDRYIQSVVRFNPGRTGTGIERDHERAIFRLGQCYEALLAEAKDEKLKEALATMASSAFREVSIEYPSGKYREQALGLAQKYEKHEKKEEKK